MALNAKECIQLEVAVEDVLYMPSLDAPEDRPHPFVYWIRITNNSTEAVTIKGRKWVITQEGDEKIVVEGEGVVNQTPRLEPGEDFSYNSYHVISRNSVAEGTFFAMTDSEHIVYTRIPSFEMTVPQWA